MSEDKSNDKKDDSSPAEEGPAKSEDKVADKAASKAAEKEKAPTLESLTKEITELEAAVTQLERNLRITQGKLKNRSPEAIKDKKNLLEELEKEAKEFERIFSNLASTASQPKTPGEVSEITESLRRATILWMKHLEMEPDSWTALES